MPADPIAHIPYGRYWSSPFAKWQGSLSSAHSLELAAAVTAERLSAFGIDGGVLGMGVLGTTVPQKGAFYGLPWLASMAGLGALAGPTIAQACATGARVCETAARAVAAGEGAVLCVTADRTSNGPHIYYPDPQGPGGTGLHEDWILANFDADPATALAMIDTAENVSGKYGVSREEQDAVTLLRYAQYESALADDRAFQRRYMPDIELRRGRKTVRLSGDEGITQADEGKIRALSPVREGGSVTFAGQTHPADGNAGLLITDKDRARMLAAEKIGISILGFGQARVAPAHMPEAPIPAARRALREAEVAAESLAVVTSHNPFAVNDIVFSRELGIPLEAMNPYGCSLVYGHPQAPTGMRAIIELIEALAAKGGGYGLFEGCAAGDSAMAVVLKVEDAR